jgi:hypothetical protein
MLHKIIGALTALNLVLLLVLCFSYRQELFELCVVGTLPALIVAKWSIYKTAWRWQGLVAAPPSVIYAVRWAIRGAAFGTFLLAICASFIGPGTLAKWGLHQPLLALRHVAVAFLGIINAWCCAFVLFGDQTAASTKTRRCIGRVKSRLFAAREQKRR